MKHFLGLGLVATFLVVFATGCDDDEPTNNGNDQGDEVTFTVKIENVSTPGTIPGTDRAGGAVPLSPGVYAVYDGANPIFTVGGMADAGLELIAEDGETGTTAAALSGNTNVAASGQFFGPDGPIKPDESSTFMVTASPGAKLQLATMFVQSNDWFYAFSGDGIALWDGSGNPVSGDVTASLTLYDAGTEEDTAPGTGPDQKPAQGEEEINVGPDDDNSTIRLASENGFDIPEKTSVIKVTITPGS